MKWRTVSRAYDVFVEYVVQLIVLWLFVAAMVALGVDALLR